MPRVIPRGTRLCGVLARALKLDRSIVSMKIDAHCSQPIRITVEFFATPEDDEAMAGAIERLDEHTFVACNDAD